ncbi:hypothetical protein [Amycolatopsis sp. CA-128772]|uniref:hypothetical protein n=1 Tax=Amycolatopsis sp. CA-128772 TaxID=2073159 RepID=UPI000CD224F3|nr:hypothetical protein [Amycolatopsis sp. CA-128772]
MTTTDTGGLAHAVDTELQQQREDRGWSRAALAAWCNNQVKARTLITWEKATRSMSLRQLGDASRLYLIRPSELLARAERRIGWNPELAVDFTALAATQIDALRPAARWAQQRLYTGEPSFRALNPDDLASFADRSRLSIAHLTILLSTEAPVHP